MILVVYLRGRPREIFHPVLWWQFFFSPNTFLGEVLSSQKLRNLQKKKNVVRLQRSMRLSEIFFFARQVLGKFKTRWILSKGSTRTERLAGWVGIFFGSGETLGSCHRKLSWKKDYLPSRPTSKTCLQPQLPGWGSKQYRR